jgi:hypothetical protein
MIGHRLALIRYYPCFDALANTPEDLIAVEGFDQAEDPIAALADQIADRVAFRLGPQLTRLAASTDPAPARELWSARRVAAHYGVSLSFVYQHADELGCVRLGGGSCARLRFDPVAVQARWALIGGALPDERPQRRRSQRHRRRATHQHDEDFLLEFKREP